MPQYLLLLYAEEPNPEEHERREAEMPRWVELTENLDSAGLLLGSNRLHPVDAATTVRIRNEETEILDGPFAVTKECLGGYYLLDCADLDQALKQAAKVPLARYGSVEVRPIMYVPGRVGEQGAAAAS